MKACKTYHESLILYLYNELPDPQRQELEAHCEHCRPCAAELRRLQQLHRLLPHKPAFKPDETTMQQLRATLSRRLWELSATPPRPYQTLRNFRQPALKIAFAVFIFALGFFLGRQNNTSVPAAGQADLLANLLTASQQIQIGNSAINPLLAGVERLRYDPHSGNIEVYYTTVNDILLQGKLDNPAVRRLLHAAMLEEANPAVRLHAVKALKSLAENRSVVDRDILNTLTILLDKEQNPGVRLKVLNVMKALLPNPYVKNALMGILVDEPNDALRIESLKALLEKDITEDDLSILRWIAQEDANSYIRSLALKKVLALENPQLPGAAPLPNFQSYDQE